MKNMQKSPLCLLPLLCLIMETTGGKNEKKEANLYLLQGSDQSDLKAWARVESTGVLSCIFVRPSCF